MNNTLALIRLMLPDEIKLIIVAHNCLYLGLGFNKAVWCCGEAAKITISFPGSLAIWYDWKYCFNLYDPSEFRRFKALMEDLPTILNLEDRQAIRDAFEERLPMVWQDALEELKAGKSMDKLLAEMRDGHVLRVLGKCGFDVEQWLDHFREFNNGTDASQP